MSNAFRDLGLKEEICTALDELGFETPSPIQEEAIPELLAGHDVIGQAQTGTGKTAAFGLPLMQQIDPTSDETQAIVLTPTRELCIQVTQALRSYAEHLDINVVAVFGGAPVREQAARVRSNAHVVVATVGRMKDLISRHALVLTSARYVVLDEADEMLDLGFLEDVEKILRTCPSGRQTLLFSATMPGPIERLAGTYMYDPVLIKITPKVLTVEAIEQAHVMVSKRDKTKRLQEILKVEQPEQAIIFCRTKIGTSKLDRDLRNAGLRCKALHGDLSQGQRDGVMISFKEHKLPYLVATDVAARGLDIEHVTHVINFDMPNNTEIYVHRIGRTGRVGRTGRAITFVTPEQADDLKTIEREAKVQIGEWESPEDRIEHAPKPRRRDHSADKAASATNGSDGSSEKPKAEVKPAAQPSGQNGSGASAEAESKPEPEAKPLTPAEKLAALNLDELSPAARRDAEIKARALGIELGATAKPDTAAETVPDAEPTINDVVEPEAEPAADELDQTEEEPTVIESAEDEQPEAAAEDDHSDENDSDEDADEEFVYNEANDANDATNVGVGRVEDDYDFGGESSSTDSNGSGRSNSSSQPKSDRSPRRKSKPKPKAEAKPREETRPPEATEGHTRLFINRGARSGIDDDDVRFALVEGAVIPDEAIVDIRVLERFTFVDVEGEHGEQALERLDGTKVGGKQVRVEYANA